MTTNATSCDGKYSAALQQAGFLSAGLLATVQSGNPILCAKCHGSNALPGTASPVSRRSSAIRRRHADVVDPQTLLPLDSVNNRGSCYLCHPGSVTRCLLRGAMGAATNAGGSTQMQCQNCHTGTAIQNNGQIRNTSADENSGLLRTPINSASRKAMVACSAKAATDPPMPNIRVPTAMTTCRTKLQGYYRRTALSAARTNRAFRADGRNVSFVKGTPIGCYDCHNGPRGD